MLRYHPNHSHQCRAGCGSTLLVQTVILRARAGGRCLS